LVVGTILAHFGITADQLMREFGLSVDRIESYVRQGFAWAWPNVLLGSLVIIPIWFVIFFVPSAREEQQRVACCIERQRLRLGQLKQHVRVARHRVWPSTTL
jgi:hypothetical protein